MSSRYKKDAETNQRGRDIMVPFLKTQTSWIRDMKGERLEKGRITLDCELLRPSGKFIPVTILMKTEKTNPSVSDEKPNGNFFGETWSWKKKQEIGWFNDPKINFSFVCCFFLSIRRMYLVNLYKTREFVRESGILYPEVPVKEDKDHPGKDTWGLLIPMDTLLSNGYAEGPFQL